VINFRYHVVSLAAVFLALAIGLVVGTAAANGPIADNLKDQFNNVSADNQQLRDTLDQRTADLDKAGEFATEAAPVLLAGKLSGKKVLVLSLEGNNKDVDKTVDGVSTFLQTAGATVTGQVKLTEKFTAPTSKDQLLDTADASAPPAVSGALPNQNDGVDTSAALLATLLVGRSSPVAVDGTRTVLQAYESQGFISYDGDFTAPAEAVVLVAGAPTTGKDAKDRSAAAMTVVNRFELAGSLVVGGLSAGGVVSAVRSDTALGKQVSTVDNTVTAFGQVAAVLAVADRMAGKAGHYGTGDGATSMLPKSGKSTNGS
jgi:copper transport outer membrane protein MctB